MEEKRWLAAELASGRQTTKALSMRYNIKMKTLMNYKRNFLKGFKMHSKKGRPRCFDDEALSALKDFIGTNPNASVADVLTVAIAKQQETWQRHQILNGGCNDVVRKTISRVTVETYIRNFRQGAELGVSAHDD